MRKTISVVEIQKKLQEVQAVVQHNVCVSEKACRSVAKSNGTLKRVFGPHEPIQSH